MYSILVLEMQKDMVPKGAAIDHGDIVRAIVPKIQKLLGVARERGVPVIYGTLYFLKGDPIFEAMPAELRHCLPGTSGIEVIDELKPKERDYVVHTYRMDPFLYTNLEHILRMLKVDTLILTGLNTDVGCLLTAVGAFQRGFSVIVVTDCCASWTEERHQRGLAYLKQFKPFVEQLTLDETISRLEQEAKPSL